MANEEDDSIQFAADDKPPPARILKAQLNH
jgi:hypothetical protein